MGANYEVKISKVWRNKQEIKNPEPSFLKGFENEKNVSEIG